MKAQKVLLYLVIYVLVVATIVFGFGMYDRCTNAKTEYVWPVIYLSIIIVSLFFGTLILDYIYTRKDDAL